MLFNDFTLLSLLTYCEYLVFHNINLDCEINYYVPHDSSSKKEKTCQVFL